jgi:hypothetical protein
MSSLLKSHRAKLCVEEIMTAGRTGDDFLMCGALGLEADYISLGKFITQGIILERHGSGAPSSIQQGSGVSLGASMFRMRDVLSEVELFQKGTVEAARQRMIEHLTEQVRNTLYLQACHSCHTIPFTPSPAH